MEQNPSLNIFIKEPLNLKILQSMPEQDLQRIVGEAVDARDKFLQWSRDNYPQLVELSKNKTLRDRMAESPSKKLLRGTLLTLGLSTLGVAAIADKLNIDLEGSLLFSYGTFIAPVLEELVFRSKKIPHFISKVGDVIGLPIRSDQARITNNMLFALGHIIPMFDAKKKRLPGVKCIWSRNRFSKNLSRKRNGSIYSFALDMERDHNS